MYATAIKLPLIVAHRITRYIDYLFFLHDDYRLIKTYIFITSDRISGRTYLLIAFSVEILFHEKHLFLKFAVLDQTKLFGYLFVFVLKLMFFEYSSLYLLDYSSMI